MNEAKPKVMVRIPDADGVLQPVEDYELIPGAKRFVSLVTEKKKLAARLKEIEGEIDAFDETMPDKMFESGMARLSIDGYTVFPKKDPHVELIVDGADDEEKAFNRIAVKRKVIETLEAMGHEDIITYNHQSFGALVRGLADDDGEVSGPLGTLVKVENGHRIGARVAGGKKNDGQDDE